MDKKEIRYVSKSASVRLSDLAPNSAERTEQVKKAVGRAIAQYGEAIKRLADE